MRFCETEDAKPPEIMPISGGCYIPFSKSVLYLQFNKLTLKFVINPDRFQMPRQSVQTSCISDIQK